MRDYIPNHEPDDPPTVEIVRPNRRMRRAGQAKSKKAGRPMNQANQNDPSLSILRFFSYAHLPPRLADVSKPFCDLAEVVSKLPQSAERSVSLRHLLDAKDAAVRAAL